MLHHDLSGTRKWSAVESTGYNFRVRDFGYVACFPILENLDGVRSQRGKTSFRTTELVTLNHRQMIWPWYFCDFLTRHSRKDNYEGSYCAYKGFLLSHVFRAGRLVIDLWLWERCECINGIECRTDDIDIDVAYTTESTFVTPAVESTDINSNTSKSHRTVAPSKPRHGGA